MKKLIIFSLINGFINAFILIFMGDYFASERFAESEFSSDVFIGSIVLSAILSSIGFVFTARKQSVGRIWCAFGIEAASAMLFVITDFALRIFGISINFFTLSADGDLAAGMLMVLFGRMFIAVNLLIHIVTGVVFSILSAKKKPEDMNETEY